MTSIPVVRMKVFPSFSLSLTFLFLSLSFSHFLPLLPPHILIISLYLHTGYRKSQIERVILHKDSHDINPRTKGFGVFVTGGKLSEFDNRLYTYVSWVISSSPADKMGLKPGDKILEWDAKCLINCTYEQVVNIIDASGNSVELIIEPLNRE